MSTTEQWLQDEVEFYQAHILDTILPYWKKQIDTEYGGVLNCIDNTGTKLVSTNKYIWSQGRFLWLWSRVARLCAQGILPEDPEPYLEHAQKTRKFLEANVFLPDGECCYVLSRTGEPLEDKPGRGYASSIFADCFVILGFTELARATRDSALLERALQLTSHVGQRLKEAFVPTVPIDVPLGYRPQTFPMIMLNVKQELADALEELGDPRYAGVREEAVGEMRELMDVFLDEAYVLHELLPVSDNASADTLIGRHRCPGHTIEAMWFVMTEAAKIGDGAIIDKAAIAMKKAVELGWDPEYGGLYRYVDRDGGAPAGSLVGGALEEVITRTWDTKIWWPHSESIYGFLFAYTLTGDEELRELYEQFKAYTFATFPNPDHQTGEWIQIHARKGEPLNAFVGLPVKDPYHIMRNLLLMLELKLPAVRPGA